MADLGKFLSAARLKPTIYEFPVSPDLNQVAPVNRMRLMDAYCHCLSGSHPKTLPVCRAVIEYLWVVRDELLSTYRHRLEFLSEARKIWPQLQRLALERVTHEREQGNVEEARNIIRELTIWSEQFKNRLLVEELFLKGVYVGKDGASLLEGWLPWQPKPNGNSIDDSGSQPPKDSLGGSLCLTVAIDSNRNGETTESKSQPQVFREQASGLNRDELLGERLSLEELVPKDALYVRLLFDSDSLESRLRWWAWKHGEEQLVLVASGESREGARGELEDAINTFGAGANRYYYGPEGKLDATTFNEVFAAYVATMNSCFDLSELQAKDEDLVFHVEGPLLSMPLAWLESADGPLWEVAESTSSVISLTLRKVSERFHKLPERRLLSVYWDKRTPKSNGLLGFMCSLRNELGQELSNWELWSLGEPIDSLRATRSRLCEALSDGARSFGAVVVNAHGLPDGGIQLALNDLAPSSDIKADYKADFWDGDGVSLEHTDLLVLASCSVGRLKDRQSKDVEGLYARLVANRARTVVTARWDIDAITTKHFVLELMRQYDAAVERATGEALPPFAKARAMAQARKIELQRELHGPEHDCRAPTIAAFEMYGLA